MSYPYRVMLTEAQRAELRGLVVIAVPMTGCLRHGPVGIPLEESWGMPGQAVPKDGYLVPNDAPGFGLEIPNDW